MSGAGRLALVVTVAATDAELASDRLFAAGVAGVEERPGPSGPGPGRVVELWTHVGEDATDVAEAVELLDSVLGEGASSWRTVDATLANAGRNGVGAIVDAGARPLADVVAAGDTYDLVFANVLAPALIELAADLVAVTADDGRLIVSGTLAGRDEHVVAALGPLAVGRRWELDGWSATELGMGS